VDSFTEVEHEGWGSRIMDSIKGVAIGAVLFLISFPVLFFNEGNFVATKKALEEGAGQVIEVKNDEVKSENEGKLIHTNGMVKTDAVLTDSDFSVSVPAVRLKRKAVMFQWKEKKETKSKKKLGGGKKKTTTYTYETVWSDELISSSGFKVAKGHQNPGNMPYSGKTWDADSVSLGAFKLTKAQIGAFGGWTSLDPSKTGAEAASDAPKDDPAPTADPTTCPACNKKLKSEKGLAQHAKDKHKKSVADLRKAAGGAATSSGGSSGAGMNVPAGFVALPGGGLYQGKNPKTPEVGDVKISWEHAPPADVTVVAKQTGETFGDFKASNGKSITDFRMGKLTAAEVFEAKQAANVMFTWILRLVGFLMMAIGLSMVFKPIAVVADVIPFLGDLIGLGFGLAAFGIAACLSLLTIAVGWVFYRPMIGIPLVLLAIGIIVGLFMMAKGKKAGGAPAGGGEKPAAA
jgi:hypothetical protein